MEKAARLILFQMKDLSDEKVDALVDQLYEWGARAVQAMKTSTPRRPGGYSILIDVDANEEWRFARDLAAVHGIDAYHQIQSVFHYQPVARAERPVIAAVGGRHVGITVRFELIGTERKPVYVRVEDEDIQRFRDEIARQAGIVVPADSLRKRLEAVLMEETGFVVEIDDALTRSHA